VWPCVLSLLEKEISLQERKKSVPEACLRDLDGEGGVGAAAEGGKGGGGGGWIGVLDCVVRQHLLGTNV
jgi:hypothetical protein